MRGQRMSIASRVLGSAPRVLVVDGSRVVRQLIARVLSAELPAVEVVGCASGAGAATGQVLYVEDSRVVALATTRVMQKHGLSVQHVISAEDALRLLADERAQGRQDIELVLTDVSLKGALTGGDLLERIRGEFG